MPGAQNFTDLLIWKRARQWSKDIFWMAHDSSFANDQRLVIQINDSSESVMSNIAEGFGRGTQEEFITFLGYAIGSRQHWIILAWNCVGKRSRRKSPWSRINQWNETTHQPQKKLTEWLYRGLQMLNSLQ